MNNSLPPCPICESRQSRKASVCEDMVIYRCDRCRMMYQSPDCRLVCTHAFAVGMFEERLPLAAALERIAGTTAARIARAIGQPLNGLHVVEVGSGMGALGACLLKAGAHYVGIEASEELLARSRGMYPSLEGFISQCEPGRHDLPAGHYDLVVMIDTLEHIPRPVEYLRTLRHCLRRNGRLYLEVPNERWLFLKGALRRWMKVYGGYVTHPGHVNLFTREALGDALKLAGFGEIRVSQYSVYGDADRMEWALKGRASLMRQICCPVLRHSGIDLLLQQGNLWASAKWAGGRWT